MKLIFLTLVSLSLIGQLCSDRILVFLPLPIWSHQMQYEKVWTALAEKGHDVTLYSGFTPKRNITNLKYVSMQLPNFQKKMKTFNPTETPTMSQSEVLAAFFLWNFGLEGLHETYDRPEFKELMASKSQYDLIIVEAFFAMESSIALGHRFKAPTIVMCTFKASDNTLDFLGSPNLPSFMPDFRTRYTDRMSFYQRFRNFYILVLTKILEYIYYYPQQQAMIDQHFGKDYPSLYSMLSNISLTFIYTNVALTYAVPLAPNIIPVGGMHLNKPGKLPEDLQKRADAAKNGFIYMSFGSVVDPSKMNSENKKALLSAFKKLQIPIFWKIDITDDPDINTKSLPDNVFVQKWYPQLDILAHPNLRLFITHGGISSLMEASSSGVPVLGVPFFGDQYHNLMVLRDKGYALIEEFAGMTEQSFLDSVNTILNDKSYKQNALKWARITNDEIVSPLDKSVYWIEYVLRHKGAHHLSTAARQMPWYQMYSVDVIAFIAALVYVMFKLLVMCCRSSQAKVSSSKKKN